MINLHQMKYQIKKSIQKKLYLHLDIKQSIIQLIIQNHLLNNYFKLLQVKLMLYIKETILHKMRPVLKKQVI